MSDEPPSPPEEQPNDRPVADAPSPRAKALREELLGSALALDEVAYILSLDRTTVAKYLREGVIAGFQIGREWLVTEQGLRGYVQGVTEGGVKGRIVSESARPGERSVHRGIVDRMLDLPFGAMRRASSEQEGMALERFDKFTERARKVLMYAQEEATRFGHNYIGTEHLLLGLVREGENVACRVLANLGVEMDRVRSQVESIIGRGETPASGEIGLTPRAKKVIELAVDEARHLNHHYIGTEHLLLGMIREGNGIAASVLESLNVHLKQVRGEIIRVLSQSTRARGAEEQTQAHPVPPEASTLVGVDEPAHTCAVCTARNPGYFRFCFNCGTAIEQE